MKLQKANRLSSAPQLAFGCQPHKVHSIHLEPQEYSLFSQRYCSDDYIVLSLETRLLPYLSLQENLFLNSSIKKKAKKQLLLTWLPIFHWSTTILTKEVSALSTYERLKCQLLQFVFSEKETMLVTDIFSKLTVPQKQELLPLFQQITRRAQKQLILLTNDRQIADNPYIDVKLSLNKTEKD